MVERNYSYGELQSSGHCDRDHRQNKLVCQLKKDAMGPDSLCISVVTVANLPQGMGRTARLRTLAAALVGMGHRVEIWNQHSLETAGMQQVSGDLCGARYEYVLGTIERERGFRAIKL